jgi:hypothetical protein
MRLFLLGFLLAGCANPNLPEAGAPLDGERVVEGTITAIDLDPLAYDGDGRILVAQRDGSTITVLVPARSNLCQARDLGDVGDVETGDRIEARGTVVRGGVLPCASPDHFFREVD